MKTIYWIILPIPGGFIAGVLFAYIRFGLEGKGWSVPELMRDVRWFIMHDVIDLPFRFVEWLRRVK